MKLALLSESAQSSPSLEVSWGAEFPPTADHRQGSLPRERELSPSPSSAPPLSARAPSTVLLGTILHSMAFASCTHCAQPAPCAGRPCP